MKKIPFLLCPLPVAAVLLTGLVISAGSAPAQAVVTQELTLEAGWNAVWLEVEPVYPEGHANAGQTMAAEDLFTNPTVLSVATPKPLAGTSEFFASDADNTTSTNLGGAIGTFNQNEWQQWKRSNPATADSISAIRGNRPYLIETASAIGLTVSGKVKFFRPTWIPDRYNLIGFGFEGGAPTFADFFGSSGNRHSTDKIYRMSTAGNWQGVAASDPMKSGEAYWVFANGPSNYMGPVAVDFDFSIIGRLNFGGPGDAVAVNTGIVGTSVNLDLKELVFTNLGGVAAEPGLDLIVADSEPGNFSLQVVTPDPSSLAYDSGNQVDASPGPGAGILGRTIPSGSSGVITLGAQRNWDNGLAGRTNIYRLNTGLHGAAVWLPINALHGDLQGPTNLISPGASSSGLWVGEVIVNGVTSIVEDGAPVRPAAAPAPMRLILHSNGSSVSLLSQVTVMQTKSADTEAGPEPVLVVDFAQIPFFEGIKERNGKKVGIRLEAVAYDMPRSYAGADQPDLLGDAETRGEPTFLSLDTLGLTAELQVALGTDPSLRTADQNTLIETSSTAIATATNLIPVLLPGYLESRNLRPPNLKETYRLTLPMDGAIGAGTTVRSASSAPLVLDPFHRSNPFRHAFHQRHARGVKITRTLEISFDADANITGRLRGTYRETIKGLTKSDIILTGTVEMRRVSEVTTLQGAQ
jgi:hypothetical protein